MGRRWALSISLVLHSLISIGEMGQCTEKTNVRANFYYFALWLHCEDCAKRKDMTFMLLLLSVITGLLGVIYSSAIRSWVDSLNPAKSEAAPGSVGVKSSHLSSVSTEHAVGDFPPWRNAMMPGWERENPWITEIKVHGCYGEIHKYQKYKRNDPAPAINRTLAFIVDPGDPNITIQSESLKQALRQFMDSFEMNINPQGDLLVIMDIFLTC